MFFYSKLNPRKQIDVLPVVAHENTVVASTAIYSLSG